MSPGSPSGTEPASWRDDDVERLAGIALRLRLADADDRGQPGAAGGFRLGAHHRVGLAVVGAPLGMADDDRRRAGIRQHFRRNVAGMRARRLRHGSPARRSGAASPCVRQRICAISVAGGQSIDVDPARRAPRAPSAIAAASSRLAARPFIFQLPAIRVAHVGEAPAAPRRAAPIDACERRAGVLCSARRGGDAPGLFLSARGFFMLDQLRQGAQGWVSKVLMILLVLSFAVWGIGGFEGYGAGTLATRRRRGGQRQRIRPRLRAGAAQRPAGRPAGHARPGAVAAAPERRARRRGARTTISASPTTASPRRSPTIRPSRAPTAAFDRDRFTALLAQCRHRPRRLRPRRAARSGARGRSRDTIGAGLDVPQPLVEALYRFQNEERTVSFVVVDESVDRAGRRARPTRAADLFRRRTRSASARPNTASSALLTLDPATLADPAAVTDEDVAAEYERRKASFTQPERRRIEQIRFDTPRPPRRRSPKIEGGNGFRRRRRRRGMPPPTSTSA